MKKIFNIFSHQGNANPNDIEIPSHSSQNGCHQGNKQQQTLARMGGGAGAGRGILIHCWWECKLVQALWKSVWQFLKKLKTYPMILLYHSWA
jgi:hypothetical protein